MKSIIKIAEEVQRKIDERVSRIGKGDIGRILKMARKPTRNEYTKVLIITGVGIIIIGGMGFAIYYILSVLLKIPK